MSLWYSRLAAAEEDYQAFFVFLPDEQEIPRVEYQFDKRLRDEIESLRSSLLPTLALAFDLCKHAGVSQKWQLNAIRLGRSDYPADLFRGKTRMPAVLIGNVAHARPESFAAADLGHGGCIRPLSHDCRQI